MVNAVIVMSWLMFTSSVYAQNSLSSSILFPTEDVNRSIYACPIYEPINLNGIMDEQCWGNAVQSSDFIQTEPNEGALASEKTEVKVLYDEQNLFIGVICYDSEPEKIVHNELQVDGEVDNDDNFIVVLDTFNDKRSGFYFMTNPNGARFDGKITGINIGVMGNRQGPRGVNKDWNGIWDVAANIGDYGWSVEIVIPFKTLRFTSEELQNWGINFQRNIVRKNEESLWTSWGRDDGIMQLTKAGLLCNLEYIKRGKLLEVKPYVLGGLENENGKADEKLKSGLDFKYPLASDLTLDFTTFTDFAQIEADRTQINLTRFDIRYPEKRDFFLEGAEIFEFSTQFTTPFYSRKIGITPDREQVPILAGAKVTGKFGRYNLGIMNIQTDEKNGYNAANYSVLRIKRDIFEKSSIGFIATNISNDQSEQSLGFDFTYKTNTFLKNKNLEITADIVENIKSGIQSGNRAGRFEVNYPNDLIDIYLYYKTVGENYEPEMGFVQRKGANQYITRTAYSPRPNLPYIRQLRFSPINLNAYTDMSGKIESYELEFSPIGITTNTDERFTFNVQRLYEHLDEEFNIFSDVYIPEGEYEWWNYEARFETNSSRRISGNVEYQLGDFYNGTKTTLRPEFNLKMNRNISLSTEIEYNGLTIGSRSFNTREYSFRLNTNISTRLAARTYLQWNNEDKIANLNFRLHYIPKIGSDIFFVYNHLWDGYQDYDTLFNTGIAKVAYQFTF